MNKLNTERFRAEIKGICDGTKVNVKDSEDCFFVLEYDDIEIAVGWNIVEDGDIDEDVVCIETFFNDMWVGDSEYVVLYGDMSHDECAYKICRQIVDSYGKVAKYAFSSMFDKVA